MDVVEHGQWVGKNLSGSDDAFDILRPGPWSCPKGVFRFQPKRFGLGLFFMCLFYENSCNTVMMLLKGACDYVGTN